MGKNYYKVEVKNKLLATISCSEEAGSKLSYAIVKGDRKKHPIVNISKEEFDELRRKTVAINPENLEIKVLK